MVRIFMKRKKIPQVCVFLFALYSSFTSNTFPIRRAVTLFHSPLFHMASYTLSPFATLHSPPQLHFPIHNSSLWSTTFSPFWTPPQFDPPFHGQLHFPAVSSYYPHHIHDSSPTLLLLFIFCLFILLDSSCFQVLYMSRARVFLCGCYFIILQIKLKW